MMRIAEETTDWKRVALASSFVGFVGPVGHLWVRGAGALRDPRIGAARELGALHRHQGGVRLSALRPRPLAGILHVHGLMSGRPWEQVRRDVERDFLPTYMTEGFGWAVVQVANFRLVPVRHQLLFVNVFCLVDSAFLSWVKHQDDAPWKKCLMSLVNPATKPSKPSAT